MKTNDYLSEKQLGALKAVQRINNEMHDKGYDEIRKIYEV